MFRKLLSVGALVLLPVAALAAPAVVMDRGLRAGVSISPDQLVLGGQLSFREFAPDWTFDPSLELGLGDDQSVVAINLDALYHLRLAGSDWRPYAGGGLGAALVSRNEPLGQHDHNDGEVGLNVVLGFSVPAGSGNHWFTELRLGVGGLPDLKIAAGFNSGK